jgi:PII-like signaling protein
MKLEGEGKLLRIFIGEADHLNHKPLYEVIVMKAREMGMAGATVFRGIESFGAASVIHTARILRLSEDLPLLVELVDTDEKIDSFKNEAGQLLEQAGCGGLITEERAHVIQYTAGK